MMETIAVLGPNAVTAATILRRDGIACGTQLSGSLKRQMKRCRDSEIVVLALSEGLAVKDMLTGVQVDVEADTLIETVRFADWNGLYLPADLSEQPTPEPSEGEIAARVAEVLPLFFN